MRIAAVALPLVTSLVALPAFADSFVGTRFDMHEKTHLVEARLEHGHATLVVTRTVENPGPKSDQATFHIDLPQGAVATRLRTSAVGTNGQTTWFEGELMEAEAAAKKYQELTGIGGYYPKDPALLSWRSQQHLALQVFPVPARGTKTVEYTLRIPMQYEAGAYKMTLPILGTDALPAKVKFAPGSAEDVVEVNGVTVTQSTAVVASRELEVRVVPRSSPMIEGALASFGFAEQRALIHGRVTAAPRLSQVPTNAAVVVLIDASRSMEAELSAELAATRAYLSHFTGGEVEVLTFDRSIHSPFGGPLAARDAASRLQGFHPTLANGSRIDEAIAAADQHLARSSAPAKRILLLTDLRVREALTAERFAARPLTSGAIVHVATVSNGAASVARHDESPWAKLPRATGGLFWMASCSDVVDAATRTVFEEWARPKRIEKVVVKGLPNDFAAPEELLEGQGIEHFTIDAKPASQLSIEGEMWSRSVRWSTSPSADETRRWSALVFGSDLLSQLSEKEQMTLALHGRAVSPVTSYLAIEPGVRPSTEGLEEGEGIGLGGVGTLGHGFGSGSGRLMGGRKKGIDRQAFLDKALVKALDTCGAKDARATATLESTLVEVVDVHDVALTQTRNPKIESCVTEELWKLDLPSDFEDAFAAWTAKTPQ